MSIRNDLLVNLQTALEAITEANGYNTDIKTVTRDATAFGTLQESHTPAIWIPAGGSESRLTPVGTNQRRMMVTPLMGRVEKKQNVTVLYESFLADLRKCLHAADLGTYFIDLKIVGLEEEIAESAIVFIQEIEIRYYYPEASP